VIRPRTREGKGTAASNTYRKASRRTQPDHRPLAGEVSIPEQVIVSMAEVA
jgi:hypothetical protein